MKKMFGGKLEKQPEPEQIKPKQQEKVESNFNWKMIMVGAAAIAAIGSIGLLAYKRSKA